jgi:hypothetical protein
MAVRSAEHWRLHPTVFAYALGVWVVFAVLATANGLFRVAVLEPRLAEPSAHRLSTALLAGLVLAVAFVYFRRGGISHTYTERLLVGVVWVALTVAFEFSFGRYVAGQSTEELLYNYAVLDGRVFVVVLLAVFLAPLLFGRES